MPFEKRQSTLNRLRHLFGRFNLTEFEAALIDALLVAVETDTRRVIHDQLGKFNRVSRVLQDDERIDHGSTTFYWHRFGRSRFSEFENRLPYDKDSVQSELARCSAVDSEQRTISVSFHTLMGVFREITFWSDDRIWYPIGGFEIGELVVNEI